MLDSAKALVTGGAGFIGSNVAGYLLGRGWQVRILDNLSTGRRENLYGLDVEFVEGDVRDPDTARRACRGVDAVFHIAASVGRQRSLDDPLTDSGTNLLGTVNILEGMLKHDVERIVHSSSAAIFGELMAPSVGEDHPQNADSPYGVSKLAAEKMVLAYSGIYGISAVCLRYFNTYGINQRYDFYGNVIPIFARRIRGGKRITIFGDGEQTRDFANVADIARANCLATGAKAKAACYNVGSGSSITVNKLAGMMQDIAGKRVEIEYAPERLADVRHCSADISKIRAELGYEPTVGLEEGLREYMGWFERDTYRLEP